MILEEKEEYDIKVRIKCDKCGKEEKLHFYGELDFDGDRYQVAEWREDLFNNHGWEVDGMSAVCFDCIDE